MDNKLLTTKQKFVSGLLASILILVMFLSLSLRPSGLNLEVLGVSDSKETSVNLLVDGGNLTVEYGKKIFHSASTIMPRSKSVVLDIPLIPQEYSLSCESASLQMALQYRDVYKTQDELMENIGVTQPVLLQESNGIFIWGDPDIGFVGDYKGKYMTIKDHIPVGSGWGTHEGPVLSVAQKYRAGSWSKKLATTEDLKLALYQNMPVIFWYVGAVHDKNTLEYYTPNGKKVLFKQFHVNVLIGYNIDENGNESWIFNDPIYGRLIKNSKDMLSEWNAYNSRMVAIA